jgi:hypothetical protein
MLEPTISQDIEQFTKPCSLDYKDIGQWIEELISGGLNKFGSKCDFFLEQIAQAIYDKKAHNGCDTIRNDKKRILTEYTFYLNQKGLSKQEHNFLFDSYLDGSQKRLNELQGGHISDEIAGYLWCFYPTKTTSLAARYEKYLKQEIQNSIHKVIVYWERYNVVNYLKALQEQKCFK